MLKRLAPTFIGLTSFRSKYAIECVNFLTKVNWLLPEKERAKVLPRAVVNNKKGRNIPADMQQENNIKMVKTVLKSLGAGKSEAAMVRSSRAAPAVTNIASQFQEGAGIKMSPSHFEHHKKTLRFKFGHGRSSSARMYVRENALFMIMLRF